jgi:hypothetical protein
MLPDAGVTAYVTGGVSNVPTVAQVAEAAGIGVHFVVSVGATAHPATFIELAELNPPATPATAAVSASPDRLMNLGNAVAARIPRITITTTSSIRVKPCWVWVGFMFAFS